MKYENGKETKKIILEVSHALFFNKGFHETSIREIAKHANLSSGSLYKHFKNKEDILHQLIQPHVDELKQAFLNGYEIFKEKIKKEKPKKLNYQLLNDDDFNSELLKKMEENIEIWEFVCIKSQGTEYEKFLSEISQIEYKMIIESLNMFHKNKEYLNCLSENEIYYITENSFRMIFNYFRRDISPEERKRILSIIETMYTPFWLDFFNGSLKI